VRDETILPQLCEDETKYQQLMEETYMEKYYDLIVEFTFPSVFRSLSREGAAAIVKAHAHGAADSSDAELNKIASDIDAAKDASGWKSIFIRLSSRSPKDAPLASPAFRDVLKIESANVERFEKDLPAYEGQETNRKMHALYRASTYAMKATTGQEALNFLVHSKRIQDDLKGYADGTIQDFNLVVREFRTFDPDLEFRGFIYQGKMTALSQYNEYVYFPLLQSRKQQVLDLILKDFHEKIAPRIPLKDYVLDFVLCTAKEEDYDSSGDRYSNVQVFVIEVNPLAEFAGTGLFTWEKDKATLLGKKPFEFRILEKTPPFAAQQIPADWQQFLD